MNKTITLALLCFATLSACKNDDSSTPAAATAAKPQVSCARAAPAAPDNPEGGCRIRLLKPAPCEEIDLSNGKVYEFAWTTDGTNCETPYTAYIAGNPIVHNEDDTLGNVGKWTIPASDGVVSGDGGIARLRLDDLKDLTSTDGSYEWVIEDPHLSHPVTQIFRVRK